MLGTQPKGPFVFLNLMERPYPMDRLVCGDVGFGKTEIEFNQLVAPHSQETAKHLLHQTTYIPQFGISQ